MKYVILVGDGMGDYPVPELDNQSPLQKADIPLIRSIAASGELRMVQTVPIGLPPGSDVANLALMGYNASENYTGRAPIEAAGAQIPMTPEEVAYRCNLVTVDESGRMDDYSAGHISTEEGRQILETLARKFNHADRSFHPGVQYRHLLKITDGPMNIRTFPPHDIAGQAVVDHLPEGPGAEALRDLMERSKALLAEHPVNQQRRAEGKKPATQIWLWGQGRAMRLDSYQQLYGLRGGVITAVDLVKGLGRLAGLEAPDIEGATGFLDTNYAGKRETALRILDREDFVYVHIEAPDECGHIGRADLKVQAIEAYEREIVRPVFDWLENRGEPYRLVICTDHRTPVALRGHTAEPVPMTVLRGPVGTLRPGTAFDETVHNGQAECMACDWIREVLLEKAEAPDSQTEQ